MLKMTKRLIYIVVIFPIMVLAYGLAVSAIVAPDQPFSANSLGDTFLRPFGQLFGELMLEDMQAQTTCLGPSLFGNCGHGLSMVRVVVLLLLFAAFMVG